MIDHGAEGDYDLEGVRDRWKYGNFFEMKVEYGYVLREGETEPPEELDRFCSAMRHIAAEAASDPEQVKAAPHQTGLRRLNETQAARKPRLRYQREDETA